MPEGILAGTRAYWRQQGAGPRSVFFLHCTLGHSGAWKGVMSALGADYQMVAMDLPGHGRTGARDLSRTWQTQSRDMALELIEAGSTPVDLVGHSFGATVALRLTSERPDLVRSLTLIESVFFSAAKDAKRPEFDAHMNAHHAFYTLLDKQDKLGAARAFSELWGGQVPFDSLPQAQRDYMADRIDMIRAGGESLLGEGPDYIPLARIAEIKLPVLLIEGSETDPVVSAVHASLDETLLHSSRKIVSGGGHMVPISHPVEVAEAMRAFFNP